MAEVKEIRFMGVNITKEGIQKLKVEAPKEEQQERTLEKVVQKEMPKPEKK